MHDIMPLARGNLKFPQTAFQQSSDFKIFLSTVSVFNKSEHEKNFEHFDGTESR